MNGGREHAADALRKRVSGAAPGEGNGVPDGDHVGAVVQQQDLEIGEVLLEPPPVLFAIGS